MGQNTEGALAAEKAPLRRAEKRKDMNDHILYNPFAGGGMIPTPQQDRLAQPKQLSVMVYHSPRKLQALMVFPSIFKGEHVKKEKVVEVLTGREITVEFDAPKPLQIDVETIPEVRAYRVAVSTREC